MNKYFLFLLFLGICSSCSFNHVEPKFFKNQKVIYQIPSFYQKVCSGVGVIDDYTIFNEKVRYTILTEEPYCPSGFWTLEENLKAFE